MLEAQLSRLETSELVRRLNEADPAYLFKHGLVQDTAYTSLLNQERKRLHLLVGESLEALYPGQRAELAPLLAQHFANAGDDVKTLEYATLAGDAAARVDANTEALEFYTRALELAQRLDAPTATLEELFLKRGRVQEVKNDYQGALENYAAMMRVAEARGDRGLELAALMAQATIHSIPSSVYDQPRAQELNNRALELARAINDPAAQAKILWNLMLMHSRVGVGFRRAVTYGEEALRIARENNLRERLAYLLNDLSPILVFHGELERGEQYNLEARAMWREFKNLPMLSDNLGYAVMNYLIGGNFDAAIAASEEGLRLSREINNAWNEAFAQSWIGEAYLERGEIETAERVMLAAIELGARAFPPTLVVTRADLARLYTDFGDATLGTALAAQALAAAEERFPAMRPYSLSALAHAYLAVGNCERAHELLRDAPDIRNYENNPRYVIDTTRAQVEWALAERAFTHALTVVDNLWSYVEENKVGQYQPDALNLRGKALLGLGRLEEAAAVLEQARELASKMNARWSLWQILETARAVELERGNATGAETLRAEARAVIEYIAARTPEPLRAGFLERTGIEL